MSSFDLKSFIASAEEYTPNPKEEILHSAKEAITELLKKKAPLNKITVLLNSSGANLTKEEVDRYVTNAIAPSLIEEGTWMGRVEFLRDVDIISGTGSIQKQKEKVVAKRQYAPQSDFISIGVIKTRLSALKIKSTEVEKVLSEVGIVKVTKVSALSGTFVFCCSGTTNLPSSLINPESIKDINVNHRYPLTMLKDIEIDIDVYRLMKEHFINGLPFDDFLQAVSVRVKHLREKYYGVIEEKELKTFSIKSEEPPKETEEKSKNPKDDVVSVMREMHEVETKSKVPLDTFELDDFGFMDWVNFSKFMKENDRVFADVKHFLVDRGDIIISDKVSIATGTITDDVILEELNNTGTVDWQNSKFKPSIIFMVQ